MGLTAGFALDLTSHDEKGEEWDLSLPEKQRQAENLLSDQEPWLLTVSSPCIMLTTPQATNFGKECEWTVTDNLKRRWPT